MTVHLYHWEPNANSGKPMLTLAEKGVQFESHYIDLLKFDQHQPEYLADQSRRHDSRAWCTARACSPNPRR